MTSVLHVSDTDLMGRRFNGYDLLEELRSRGVSGKQAVLNKHSVDPNVIPLITGHADTALHHACMAEEWRHSMNNQLFPWGSALMETAEFEDADVVHLHLIHNYMVSLFDVPRIAASKPCVWTFHDPWPMTGHCVYPQRCEKWLTGCRGCPALDAHFPMGEDRADRIWKIKQGVFADLDVDVVVASEFMLDMVKRSPITRHLGHVHEIPFGIDTDIFLDDGQRTASRQALGISRDDFVVFFRSTNSDVKGLRHLIDALQAAPPSRPTTLLTIDTPGLVDVLARDYNIVQLGWVDDESLLARLFSACDVFLMPSKAEAFGLMAVEAMAACRPVVCFEGTSLPSVTRAPECGIAVPMEDSAALRSAIDALADDAQDRERRGRLGRELAREHYGHDRYLDDLTALYGHVLERSRSTGDKALRDVPAGLLAGVRVCFVFEYNLAHYSRYLREIRALQEAGATVQLLTSHPDIEDAPPFMPVTMAPLQFETIATGGESPARDRALGMLVPEVDLFWVSGYLSLPSVMRATKGTGVKVLYETVDLVPEYSHHGEEYRQAMLAGERELIGEVDGFITACDSYADYYVDTYGDTVLPGRPVVCDNVPDQAVSRIKPTERPLRLLFFGQLMFDRPVMELIKAMAHTSADVTFTFQGQNHLGEGPLAEIAEMGVQDRVILLDPCPADSIVETASAYDVGIVALRGDDENERRASTGKIFTYMHAGLAVLGSDLPGIARIVNEHHNGLLVPGMEPQTWAEAIERLAKLPPAEIDAMKQASLDAARQYAWENQKPLFITEFQRALGRTSAS